MKHINNKMKSIEEVIQSVHYKDSITLKEYFKLKCGKERVNNYVHIMTSKDAKTMLLRFAEVNNFYTRGYCQQVYNISKESIQDLADTMRKLKEQIFRYCISFKGAKILKEKEHFDLTELFKKFEEYGFDVHTPRQCYGFGKHWYYYPLIDGRLEELIY